MRGHNNISLVLYGNLTVILVNLWGFFLVKDGHKLPLTKSWFTANVLLIKKYSRLAKCGLRLSWLGAKSWGREARFVEGMRYLWRNHDLHLWDPFLNWHVVRVCQPLVYVLQRLRAPYYDDILYFIRRDEHFGDALLQRRAFHSCLHLSQRVEGLWHSLRQIGQRLPNLLKDTC